jgi:hypothetical protein
MTKFKDVIVIGSGLTGLAAARVLAACSTDYLVLEQDSFVGGRIRSEEYEKCILDRGFQVVLPAYPSVRSLNLPIQLKAFSRASTCITPKGKSVVADPIHNFSLFCQYFGRSPASVADLFRTLKHMKSRRFDLSTEKLLIELGYSIDLKDDFLRPFLKGVLLDPNLASPSPLSSYYLERFFLGGASLVEGGIQEFPRSLAKDLSIDLNSEVSEMSNGELTTKDGRSFAAKVIIDTRPNLVQGQVEWLATECHYFLSSQTVPLDKRLVLCSTKVASSINHIANLSEIASQYSPPGTSLLSVTTRAASGKSSGQLKGELVSLLDLQDSKVDYLKGFQIDRALPFTKDLSLEFPEPPVPRQAENTIFASDTLSYGSQHAALRMGKKAGQLAVKTLRS